MSRTYFSFTPQNKAEIVGVLETLAANPKALEQYLNDRHKYLNAYSEEKSPLSDIAKMSFCFDVNLLNVQFSLAGGRDQKQITAQPNEQGQTVVSIPEQEFEAKHADASNFFKNNVLIQSRVMADTKEGTLELDIHTEPKEKVSSDGDEACLPPVETIIVHSMRISNSSGIKLRGKEAIVIGPDVRGIAKDEANPDNDRVIALSGFIDVESQTAILQYLDVTEDPQV